MKSKFLGLVVLVCLLTLVFVSCGDGGKSAYYGTWAIETIRYEISANKITMMSNSGEDYSTLENLTWLPIDNDNNRLAVNYPKGFQISGTYTASSIPSNVGNTQRRTFYLHNNKRLIFYSGNEYRKQ